MDYLAILKRLDSDKADARNMEAAIAQPHDELNERTSIKPLESAEHGPCCPGPEKGAGCYSVDVLSGRERFIHPPRPSADWQA
jgi:hypothetical protein